MGYLGGKVCEHEEEEQSRAVGYETYTSQCTGRLKNPKFQKHTIKLHKDNEGIHLGPRPGQVCVSTIMRIIMLWLMAFPSHAAYTNGRMCPGLLSSLAVVVGLDRSWIVSALSSAEMPVDTPRRASTVTVKAVFMASSFSLLSTMSGKANSSSLFLGMGTQMRPLVWFTMKAMRSAVTCTSLVVI